MSERALACWVDGHEQSALPTDDRGLQYGDGLFETIVLRAGKARFIAAHCERLAQGCATLRIPFDAWSQMHTLVTRACVMAPPLAILKIIVTRGSATRRGYRPAGDETTRLVATLWPATPLEQKQLTGGVETRLAQLVLAPQPVFCGAKHLNRLQNVLATLEDPDPRWFESLLTDTDGHVVGGTMSNLFALRAGVLCTPPVDAAGVAGVMRGIVLRECAQLGIAHLVTRLTFDDLRAADEVFLTNVRIGVVPVRRLGEHAVPMTGLAQRLHTHIETLDA